MMGMRIQVAGFAMGGPAGVANSNGALCLLSSHEIFKLCNLPFFLVNGSIAIEKCHTCGIISAIFKSFKTLDKYWISITGSDISYNSAHSNDELKQ